jgi:hypothetical protein
MSEVKKVRCEVRDLDLLELACGDCRLELRRDQKTFKTYGGQKRKCDAAVVNPRSRRSYEIGLKREPTGIYSMHLDNYDGGEGMVKLAGRDACKLRQRYGYRATIAAAEERGWAWNEEELPDGTIRVSVETPEVWEEAAAGQW